MLHVPLMFLPEWREFLSAHCLAERKKEFDDSSSLDVVEIAQVAWHASFQREQTPISNEIIDSVQRHWEVGRGKNLSAPRPKLKYSTLTLRGKKLRFLIYVHYCLFRGLCCRTLALVAQAKVQSWSTSLRRLAGCYHHKFSVFLSASLCLQSLTSQISKLGRRTTPREYKV